MGTTHLRHARLGRRQRGGQVRHKNAWGWTGKGQPGALRVVLCSAALLWLCQTVSPAEQLSALPSHPQVDQAVGAVNLQERPAGGGGHIQRHPSMMRECNVQNRRCPEAAGRSKQAGAAAGDGERRQQQGSTVNQSHPPYPPHPLPALSPLCPSPAQPQPLPVCNDAPLVHRQWRDGVQRRADLPCSSRQHTFHALLSSATAAAVPLAAARQLVSSC